MAQKIFVAFLMIQLIFTVLLFLSGFFPLKHSTGGKASYRDLPSIIGNTRVNPDLLYTPKIDKMIIMIIDALRYDMVIRDDPYMPSLQNWTHGKEKYCVIKAKANAPTVTLPRIKALMTGSVPGYIDVVLNFQQYNVSDDNLLLQAKSKGLLCVFYGDETWLKAFPNIFNRSEPTHSFVVTDFTEVDLNVTRNVHKELSRPDWDVMILHYLGLDHIGHMESPESALVKPKLIEMDNIISEIQEYILERAKKSEKVVLLVGSDHGMRDTGGHGGTSSAEITVPYILFNYLCDHSIRTDDLNQIDMTPLMSVLLGLPIPASSVGKLHSKMLTNFHPFVALYAVHYNTVILNRHYQRHRMKGNITIGNNIKSVREALKIAEILFESAILNNFSGSEHLQAFEYYDIIQKEMSNAIIKQGVGYDMFSMVLAIVLLAQILFHVIFESKIVMSEKRISTFATVLSVMILTNPYKLGTLLGDSIIFSALCLIYFIFFVWNICFFKPQSYIYRMYMFNFQTAYEFSLFMGIILHITLSLSTSFLEEEHNIWYFGFATYLLHAFIIGRFRGTALLLLAHVILRYFNNTGVKYSTNQNIGDWFMESKNSFWLLHFYIIGLYSTASWFVKQVEPFRIHTSSVPVRIWITHWFTIIYLMFFVFLLKLYSGTISLPFIKLSFPQLNFNPLYLWINLLIGIIFCGFWWYQVILLQEDSVGLPRKLFLRYELDILILTACILYAVLCQPHNIILVPYILHYSNLFKEHCNNNGFVLIVWHLALGMVCFFFQGNSISLAAIDVSVGYRTLVNPNIFVSGFLVYFHTMGLPILSMLCLFKNIFLISRSKEEEYHSFTILASFSTFYMIFYSILVTFQRYHLFVWSVFAPKLLYISVTVSTFSILMIIVSVLETLYYVYPYLLRLINFLCEEEY